MKEFSVLDGGQSRGLDKPLILENPKRAIRNMVVRGQINGPRPNSPFFDYFVGITLLRFSMTCQTIADGGVKEK
jgi:hypothetical protein